MEEFFVHNQMYIVLAVVLLTWAGIIWYLFRLEKKIKDIEQRFKK